MIAKEVESKKPLPTTSVKPSIDREKSTLSSSVALQSKKPYKGKTYGLPAVLMR